MLVSLLQNNNNGTRVVVRLPQQSSGYSSYGLRDRLADEAAGDTSSGLAPFPGITPEAPPPPAPRPEIDERHPRRHISGHAGRRQHTRETPGIEDLIERAEAAAGRAEIAATALEADRGRAISPAGWLLIGGGIALAAFLIAKRAETGRATSEIVERHRAIAKRRAKR